MAKEPPPNSLLASDDLQFLVLAKSVLAGMEGHVEVVDSLEAAVAAFAAEVPQLFILDARLARFDSRIDLAGTLAGIRGRQSADWIAIALVVDSATDKWAALAAGGVIDDLILRAADAAYLRMRLALMLAARERRNEIEALRQASAQSRMAGGLIGVYDRQAILEMLFRETDRAQRMKTVLGVVLLGINDFSSWNSALTPGARDNLVGQVAGRTARLLRIYDLLGRAGKDEFLAVMPGCTAINAIQLAERMRVEVFSEPFHVDGEAIRLSACFGIAASQGRSPVVVLREAETALGWARTAGPESIQCFGDSPHSAVGPVAYLSPSSGDELLAW